MSGLGRYTVTVNGHETVMKLSEADAKSLGGVPVDSAPRPTPADAPAEKVAKAPANKARTAPSKGVESE